LNRFRPCPSKCLKPEEIAMRNRRLVSLFGCAALAAMTGACVVRTTPATTYGYGYSSQGHSYVSAGIAVNTPSTYYVASEPPAPLYETMSSSPGYGFVWIDGYWHWNGAEWIWVSGRWVQEMSGYVYISPYYDYYDGRYVYHSGYWSRPDRVPSGVIVRDHRDGRPATGYRPNEVVPVHRGGGTTVPVHPQPPSRPPVVVRPNGPGNPTDNYRPPPAVRPPPRGSIGVDPGAVNGRPPNPPTPPPRQTFQPPAPQQPPPRSTFQPPAPQQPPPRSTFQPPAPQQPPPRSTFQPPAQQPPQRGPINRDPGATNGRPPNPRTPPAQQPPARPSTFRPPAQPSQPTTPKTPPKPGRVGKGVNN
jgi:YXWGXW repeat-containing protein